MKNEPSIFSENRPRYAINILITILVLIGLYLSFIAKDGETLASRGIVSLKFFTVDSNILVGAVSAILSIFCLIRINLRR